MRSTTPTSLKSQKTNGIAKNVILLTDFRRNSLKSGNFGGRKNLRAHAQNGETKQILCSRIMCSILCSSQTGVRYYVPYCVLGIIVFYKLCSVMCSALLCSVIMCSADNVFYIVF